MDEQRVESAGRAWFRSVGTDQLPEPLGDRRLRDGNFVDCRFCGG